MATGSSNQGIADKLVITLRAVEKYVSIDLYKARAAVHQERLAASPRGAAVPALLTTVGAATHQKPAPQTRQVSGYRRVESSGTLDAPPNNEEPAMKTRVIQADPPSEAGNGAASDSGATGPAPPAPR